MPTGRHAQPAPRIAYDIGMEFLRRPAADQHRLGILSGTFNPPTRAHLALAASALGVVDGVLFVMPRVLPHKSYEGVGFEDRLRMLQLVVSEHPLFSLASTERGLFLDVARECRAELGARVALAFLCGRDAAERVVNWDYGRPGAFLEMLREFELLVADRQGSFRIPEQMAGRIHPLAAGAAYDDVSATEVRRRIRSSEPWEDLVPAEIVPLVRNLYLR
jgi:nicotinate (nicotinamide) nucleotide adenylyltransferase